MGRVPDPGFTGKAGNLIYYKVNGKNYVRSFPEKVRQSQATKARATLFGQASTLGAIIRNQLPGIMPFPKDKHMQTRLVTALYQWLVQMKNQNNAEPLQPDALKGFLFAEQRPSVFHRWRVNLDLSVDPAGEVKIVIPSFVPVKTIKAPPGTSSVVCRIAACSGDVKELAQLGGDWTEFIFDYNDQSFDSKTVTFQLRMPKGSLVITAISLKYRLARKNYWLNNTNKSYMPADIIDARYII